MNYLVTGGCGFLGSNIAARLAERSRRVTVFDNLSRVGATENLAWLRTRGAIDYRHGDIRNAHDVELLVRETKPDVVFHLSGQVAMTTSIADPRRDFDTNTLGSFNVLDAVRRHAHDAVVAYSSTNKVYGDLEWVAYREEPTRWVAADFPRGFPETIGLDFRSPYGCSKGAADQYFLDFARMFGCNTVVFRHSSMYGGRQYPTYDQGWIGWFCRKALEKKKDPATGRFEISGDGKQVRDLLFCDDMVDLYLLVPDHIAAMRGRAFNIGGGMENSLSLIELFAALEKELGIAMRYDRLPPRSSDQKVFVADIAAVTAACGWIPRVGYREGLKRMLQWIASHV